LLAARRCLVFRRFMALRSPFIAVDQLGLATRRRADSTAPAEASMTFPDESVTSSAMLLAPGAP
jgi:hypothetical protein